MARSSGFSNQVNTFLGLLTQSLKQMLFLWKRGEVSIVVFWTALRRVQGESFQRGQRLSSGRNFIRISIISEQSGRKISSLRYLEPQLQLYHIELKMSKLIPRPPLSERPKDPTPRHTPEVIGPHKPESFKQDTWTDWPKSSWSLFTDDFVHEKLGVFKVNLKSKLGNVSFKETLTNRPGLELHDQVKLWFNIKDDKSIWAKVNSKGDVKIQYDNGVNKIRNHDWNFYGTLKMSKTLQKPSVRFGAHFLSDKCDSDNRIRIDLEGATNLIWSHKTIVTHDKLTFGVLSVFDITKKLLTRNKLLIGYKINDSTELHFRDQNKEFRKGPFDFADWRSYFDSYTIDLVKTIDSNTKIGIQTSFKPTNPVFDFAEVVAQRKFPEQNCTRKLKLKVGTDLDVSLASKHNLSSWWNDILTVSFGVHGAHLLSNKRSYSYGAQFEFNV